MKTIMSMWATILLTLFIVQSCAAKQPAVIKQVGIKVNGGTEAIHDVPFETTVYIGDTLTIRAIVNAPYIFNGWSNYLTGNQNPATIIVKQPMTITINYTTGVSYQAGLFNAQFEDIHTYDFEVWIKTLSANFVLTAYQFALNYNSSIADTSIHVSYVSGSSQLQNLPTAGVGINNSKITFACSAPGIDTIKTTYKCIGRFKVVTSGYFPYADMQLAFNFDGNVNTILTGENVTDITQFGTFVGFAKPPTVLLKVQ